MRARNITYDESNYTAQNTPLIKNNSVTIDMIRIDFLTNTPIIISNITGSSTQNQPEPEPEKPSGIS